MSFINGKIAKIKEHLELEKFLRRQELSDKQFLISLANMLDAANYDDAGCMKMTKELVEAISPRLRKIGNRMVVL